ncbi:LTA synthase family protein [Schwartzia succinivorans]|jgi:hypothetical protein|uniref:Sulfatase n=1 Tax=Schwartzia succinivorans DSM 10502 TaxID=1123243 RepID=A0A1M4XKX6_9FIRM|nr:sulfatase-like hydrolase/transferase [Schwartzia succinivorans]SHE94086.1 Sulfatase [Schwartzia succinivorans DSM 10502]
MFEHYFFGMQQDLKLAVLPPLLCAVFRAVFIYAYAPRESIRGQWKKLYHCFRYGFWWGMDWNAYAYLIPLALVTLPGVFLPAYYELGDTVRTVWIVSYVFVLYFLFWGKMIFYYHYNDIYNSTLWLGKNADKKNLADIFFNQNHGAWILLSFIPYVFLCLRAAEFLLGIPNISYPVFETEWKVYAFNTAIFLGSIAIFYWFRFGGTFRHRLKPEWDEVPPIVKNDEVIGKATVDDLVALEIVWKHPAHESLKHSDEEAAEIMAPVMPKGWQDKKDPLESFMRKAKGPRIKKPSHIFYLLGESHSQIIYDPQFSCLNMMEGTKKWRAQEHTVAIDNFLSAGLISQPSLVSLILGIYDANMEINENKDFWSGCTITSLPFQLKKLGYKTSFWYGGGLSWGSLYHFIPGSGFDEAHGGPDICGPDAPKTWLGVYDHLFLEETARRIKASDDGAPEFHFIYTTSNHGPYNIPVTEYGFDADRVLKDAPAKVRQKDMALREAGGVWYTDQALAHFIEDMQKTYPDSLIILTGDHAAHFVEYDCDIVPRTMATLRENRTTSFALSHPELTKDMFAGNTLGGHLNIMPTIFELIAPKDFEYYSIMPSLLEHLDHITTPFGWMTVDTIGDYYNHVSQPLAPCMELPDTKHDVSEFENERFAWSELTGWIIRHPELLTPVSGKK